MTVRRGKRARINRQLRALARFAIMSRSERIPRTNIARFGSDEQFGAYLRNKRVEKARLDLIASSAWRTEGANPSVVGRLVSMGLARWNKPIGGEAELTDAGRSALEGRS